MTTLQIVNRMDTAAEQNILSHLEPGFEQDLFKAAIANVDDINNNLRLNNFAYSMRELIRTVLERLSPDEEVRRAPWYKIADEKKPDMITRTQRIKYAIQGWLSDDYVDNVLKIDHEEDDKTFRDSIDVLSKFTHVTPKTFCVTPVEVTTLALDVLFNVQLFLSTVSEARIRVRDAAVDCIDEEMIEQFYYNTQNEIDMLATHHEILSYLVTRINLQNQDDAIITMEVSGNVNVRLQWGSDGDMRRDDGYETKMSFPFTSVLTASYKNPEGDVHIIDSEMKVDNDAFFE